MSDQSMMKEINNVIEETMRDFLFEVNAESMRAQLEFEIIENLLGTIALSQDFEVEVSSPADDTIEVTVQLFGIGYSQMFASVEEIAEDLDECDQLSINYDANIATEVLALNVANDKTTPEAFIERMGVHLHEIRTDRRFDDAMKVIK